MAPDDPRPLVSKPPAAVPETAHVLWVRKQLNAIPSANLGVAAEVISARLRIVLVRWLGPDASHALIQWALDDVKPAHPVLSGARCEAGCVVGLAADGTLHDPGAMTDGFTALVVALGDRLGRVVGEEMAWRLVEQSESLGRGTGKPGEPWMNDRRKV